jgi:Disintegrin
MQYISTVQDCLLTGATAVCPTWRTPLNTAWTTVSETNLRSTLTKKISFEQNQPSSFCRLFDSPVCGNDFVEPGEQCDCGLAEQCDNPCCNASTCMLHLNATCATGKCCDLDTCRPKRAGTECRTADHECDLPEFCTGESEYCPNNFFKMDGEQCDKAKVIYFLMG